jgi:CheY-like chemotaxis protein
VDIQHSLKPWRTASCRAAREVVELAAGECERHGLEVGDQVAWASLTPDSAGEAHPHPPFAKAEPAGHVIVATRDRRFAKLMRFVLDRHGFEVTTSSRGDLLELLDHRQADAVILDAPGSLLAAGKAAAAAKALHPDVEIVVVSEDANDSAMTFAVYDKWDGMDDVVETVSRAAGGVAG